MQLIQDVAATVLPALATAVATLLTALIGIGAKHLMRLFKSQEAKDIVGRIDEAVETAVRDVSNTEVQALRDGNGKLDAAARQKLKDAAVAKVKALAGSVTVEKLGTTLGIAEGAEGDAQLVAILESFVEKGVWFMKLQQKAAENAAPVAPAAAAPVPVAALPKP